MTLIYHTFFAEYRGETPKDIVRAVHAEAAKTGDVTYERWWQHQQVVWQAKYALEVPDLGAPDAEAKLLDILLAVGALEAREKPAKSGTGHA